MKHIFSELFFNLYLWSCNITLEEYYEWIEENIKIGKKAKREIDKLA